LDLIYGRVSAGGPTCKLLSKSRFSGGPRAKVGTCAWWNPPGIGGNPRVLLAYDETKGVYLRLGLEGVPPGKASESRILALARTIFARS
jgi:hypothetical protein